MRFSRHSLLFLSVISLSLIIDVIYSLRSHKLGLFQIILSNQIQIQKFQSNSNKVNLTTEFDISNLLNNSSSSSEDNVEEAYLLYIKYLNKLRDFYFFKATSIIQQIANGCNQKEYDKVKSNCIIIVRKCEDDMRKAIPKNLKNVWDYSDILKELEDDIDLYLSEVTSKTTIINEGFFARNLKKLKWTKWILSQLILLGINFIQVEIHRILSKRAAERRLADIPEFPLL